MKEGQADRLPFLFGGNVPWLANQPAEVTPGVVYICV